MADLVSILIPAYNAEKWVGDTIKSAISQTWPKKEIIIVDDGSSDNTLAIAKQFESRSLKVISQENRGASAARNKALRYAQGDYIQWLDSDDFLASNKISVQMRIAESDLPKRTLFSGPFGKFYSRIEKASFENNSLSRDYLPVDWLLTKFRENLWMIPACWLVSRKLSDMAGGWDERLSLDDDGEYFCRVIAASEWIHFTPEARCYHRISGVNQMSRTIDEKACRSFMLSLSLSIGYLLSLEDSPRTRQASLILLQNCLVYFYPEKTELLEKINTLASKLGGELRPPDLGWKTDLMQRVFGAKKGKEVMAALRNLKLTSTVKWNEVLYRINRLTGPRQ